MMEVYPVTTRKTLVLEAPVELLGKSLEIGQLNEYTYEAERSERSRTWCNLHECYSPTYILELYPYN